MKFIQFRYTPIRSDLSLKIKLLTSKSLKEISNSKSFEQAGFEGKYCQTLLLPDKRELFIGLSIDTNKRTADRYYKTNYYHIGARAFHAIKKSSIYSITLDLAPDNITKQEVRSFLLGFLQASMTYCDYKLVENQDQDRTISLSPVLTNLLDEEEQSILNALNEGICLTRNWVDTPPEVFNPTTVVQYIKDSFDQYHNISQKIINYEELQKLGAEGITEVGKASIHKPFVNHLIIKSTNQSKKKVVLVGKGLTYDAGGLDIKTGGHMQTMKCDMGGAGLMAGVAKSIAELGGLKNIELHWITAFAENVINGNAYKPDDILTTLSGQTIEVLNTDAEGRLTLAETLTLATLEHPDYIIDAATLTGACVASETAYYSAIMGNDYDFNQELYSCFLETNERACVEEMPEIIREWVQADLADLQNISKVKQAGHITAGLFLSHFINQNNFREENMKKLNIQTPNEYTWIHMDIAGSAYNNKYNPLEVTGATGHSLQALTHWLLKLDNQI
jgi:leucyl aminopeptidase